MNQQHRDILAAIGRKQPITTAEIAEYLMDHFGYGGGMEFDAFRDQVSKTIGYLKSKEMITGEDRPQTKGKPLRFWSLANPQSECRTAEMASDVAEIQPTVQESLTVEMTPEPATTPEPVSVVVKVTNKQRLSAEQIIQGYKDAGSQGNMLQFAAGVAFAEKHHGIGS